MRTGTLVRALAVAGILAAATAAVVDDDFASAVRQDADNPVSGDDGMNETEPVLQAAALAGSEGEGDVMVNAGEVGDAAQGGEDVETGGDDGGDGGELSADEPAAGEPAADESGSEGPNNAALAVIVASAAAESAIVNGATADEAAAAGAAAASVFVDVIAAEAAGASAIESASASVDSDGGSGSSGEAMVMLDGGSASESEGGGDESGDESGGESDGDDGVGAGVTAGAFAAAGAGAAAGVSGAGTDEASAGDEEGDFSGVVLTPLESLEPEGTPDETPGETPDETPDASSDPDFAGRADIFIPTPEGDDGSVCFPAHETVELRDGSVVAMADLQLGDEVRVGADEFSPVFMFTHRLRDEVHRFVTLSTASGLKLTATPGHYIFSNGALVAAGAVRKGDKMTLGDGTGDTVVSVKIGMARGLYNPQTAHGSIVVSGVLASTYTTAVEPAFAHAVLAPLRALNWLGLSFTALESGGGALAGIMPSGNLLQ